MIPSLVTELRQAARVLTRSPGVALVIVATLGLAIGANTAVLSVVDALLLRPHTFADLNRLQLVRTSGGKSLDERGRLIAPADYIDLTRQARAFDGYAAFRFSELNLSGISQPERAEGYFVTPGLFPLLGVHPWLGRTFSSAEGEPGRSQAILLSHGFWRERFASDQSVVGRTLRVNGQPCEIAGVMPPDFNYPLGAQAWMPLALGPADQRARADGKLFVVARLRPGVTRRQADADLGSIAGRLASSFPATNLNRGFALLPLRQEQYEYTLGLFGMLQLAALFVLLLAAANVSAVLFSRSVSREKETGIRKALGAGTAQLFRLLACEVVLLVLSGAALGIAASFPAVEGVRRALPAGISRWLAGWNQIRVTPRALFASLALSVVVGLVIAVGIALRSARLPLEGVASAVLSRSASPRTQRVLRWLVVAQVSLATVLLSGAGILVRAFREISSTFEAHAPQRILAFVVKLPENQYPDAERRAAFLHRLLSDLSALPGVGGAAAATNPPASNVDSPLARFRIEAEPVAREADSPRAQLQTVSTEYFRVLKVPLVAGRVFSDSDLWSTRAVAVIGLKVAERYWPGRDPIGHRIAVSDGPSAGPWRTVVGVVADVRQNWSDPTPPPSIYLPIAQTGGSSLTFLLRTIGNPLPLASTVRAAVGRLDAELPIAEVDTFAGRIADSVAPLRVIDTLLLLFGSIALCLSVVGVYAVVSHTVARRTHEFGVRMALGASRRNILGRVLRQAVILAASGAAIGAPLFFALSSAIAGRVFGLLKPDAPVLIAVLLLLLAIGVVAAYVPARRATRVSPVVALREE